MEENKTSLTFELSDLSYQELVEVYKEISAFIDYLEKISTDISLEIEEGGKSL